MRSLTRPLIALLAAIALVVGLSACSASTAPSKSGQETENKSRQEGYDHLTKTQPAGKMSYSPTRATKNFWVKTWDEPEKLAYAYILNADQVVTGYYVFVGPPVSYCVSLIPPYTTTRIDGGEYNQDAIVPGPSVDGTFSSGGDCATKYGKDAVSGSYVEFNVGVGQNYQLFDQPLPPQRLTEAKPLGFATMDNLEK